MKKVLIQKVHRHLLDHYPDLLTELAAAKAVRSYLQKAVASVIAQMEVHANRTVSRQEAFEAGFQQWCRSLPPSRYRYLREIVKTHFPIAYSNWRQRNCLQKELLQLITFCDPLLEGLDFTTHAGDQYLRYATIGTVDDYLAAVAQTARRRVAH